MNSWVEDRRVYQALQPFQVATYLRSHGWLRGESIGAVASVWMPLSSNQSGTEIILPTDTTVGDFAVRMAELLRALSAIERRPAAEILTDISLSTSDVVRFSFLGERYDDGTVPIETGARLVAFAKDAVLAAASTSVAPRAVVPSRKPDEAMEFLQKVRLGQTERGSYVLTVQSPVRPDLEFQQELMPDPIAGPKIPYERRVMLTFSRALDATRKAAIEAAETGLPTRFLDAVQEGLSANLCEAIAGMLDAPETSGMVARFTWSPARPEDTHAPTYVSFDKGIAPVIIQASQILRERTPELGVEVEGEVIELRRPQGFDGGRITVAAQVDGKPHVVRIELSVPDYLDAIEAHRGQVRVRCRGELVRRGKWFSLLNPIEFDVQMT